MTSDHQIYFMMVRLKSFIAIAASGLRYKRATGKIVITVTSHERHGVQNDWWLDWGNPLVDSSHQGPVIRKAFLCHIIVMTTNMIYATEYIILCIKTMYQTIYSLDNHWSSLLPLASIIEALQEEHWTGRWLPTWWVSLLRRTCNSRVAFGACGWTMGDWRFNIGRATGFHGNPSAILNLTIGSAETYWKTLSNEMNLDQIILSVSTCWWPDMCIRTEPLFFTRMKALEAEKKWPPFCRRHFPNEFFVRKLLYVLEISKEFLPNNAPVYWRVCSPPRPPWVKRSS